MKALDPSCHPITILYWVQRANQEIRKNLQLLLLNMKSITKIRLKLKKFKLIIQIILKFKIRSLWNFKKINNLQLWFL